MDQRRRDVGGKFCVSGKTFPIYGGVNPIGRNKEAVVNIKSLGVSQQHAQFILVDDDLHFISDLKSSNGTFLNNKKLDPLQLYRLENGSRVKFADIEGVYSKLMLVDVEHQENFSTVSENTQNFTQNFYGSDTQIMDNTTCVNQNDKSSEMKNYIPSQILADVAEELENSYIQAHEQPTQVIFSGTEKMVTKSVGTKNSLKLNEEKLDKSEEKDNFVKPNQEKLDITSSNKLGSTFHEAETQVFEDDENDEETSYNSIIALHEAATQVIIDQDSSITLQNTRTDEETMLKGVSNENETQLIVTDHRVDSQEDTTNNLHESNIQSSLRENYPLVDGNIESIPDQEMEETVEITVTSNLDSKISQATQDNDAVNPLGISDNIIKDAQNLTSGIITQEKDVVNPLGISDNIIKDTQVSMSGLINQEKDEVNPLGISDNIIKDTQNSFCGLDLASLDDNDTEIIRPVKKSVNIFESQDSTFEDIEKSSDLISHDSSTDFISKPGCSKTSLDGEGDIVRPVKKSINIFESQDSEGIEEDSNDSVDFLTMQKISNTEKYVETEEYISGRKISQRNEKSDHNIPKSNEADGSETDLDNEEPTKNSIHMDDGSETENENMDQNKDLKSNITSADTNNKLNSGKVINKKKRKTKKLKKANVFSESDSETDIEVKENDTKVLVKVVSACSDSDTDIENNENRIIKSIIDKENAKNNESVGLILEESALEEDPKIEEKTEPKEDIPPSKTAFNRLSIGYNESLNDSDFIPPTQEENLRSISQNSKFENSEDSFKLGLTQMMEEDDPSQRDKIDGNNSENNKDEVFSEKEKSSQSGNSQEAQKKFVFKKSSLGVTESANITLDYEEDIYQAKTQNFCEDKESKLNNSTDDHVFLQPTQEAPKRFKQNMSESIPDDEIYLLSTQRLDGTPKRTDVDDFYQQSTQKLIVEESNEQKEEAGLRLSGNEFYHLPTQKLPEDKDLENIVSKESEHNDSKDDDDIFATQVMDVNSPHKHLESELENMFATQRAIPTEDSLDKIQDIVLKKQIIDDKLPTEDKDLEAILATQRMVDSPKRSKRNQVEAVPSPGKSLESQLEILFASQPSNLPPDKFVRPPNPLVNLFGDTQDTQELLKDDSSLEKEKKAYEPVESESSIRKKTCQIGLEQSFALLEAKSTKIRRSDRNKNCEEVSVSCPKSRVSMIVAPNDKKILEEEPKPIQVKNVRASRKRQQPETTTTNVKGPEKKKKRRMSETTNSSDEENQSNIASASSRQNITNTILNRIQEIEDEQDMKSSVKIIDRPGTPNRKRSSRITKVKPEENIEPTKNEYAKAFKTRTSRVNKTNDPCTSNDNMKEEDSATNEINSKSTMKINSNEDIVEKSSKTRSSKISNNDDTKEKKTKIENKNIKDKNENKSKDIEETKSSRTRTSRVTKSIVQETESSRKVVKTIENSSDSYENGERNTVNKFKDTGKRQTTPSRTLKRGSSIQVTTPPKIQIVSEATPSTSRRRINIEDTPNRIKRKLKPKVVFTMMEDPKLESQIKQLGGSVVDSIDTCTVLITKFVKRTMKLLSAVGLGKPICSEQWVKQSKKENDFLDPWDFVLVDKEAEKKWDFSLKTSLKRSLEAKLFEGYTFQLLVTNAQDVLKGAIESCGGKIVTRIPKMCNNVVVVAAPEQKDKYKKLLKQHSNLIVVEAEAIFDGVLRQEIRFEKHSLK